MIAPGDALDAAEVITHALGGFAVLLRGGYELSEVERDDVYCLAQLLVDKLTAEIDAVPRQAGNLG